MGFNILYGEVVAVLICMDDLVFCPVIFKNPSHLFPHPNRDDIQQEDKDPDDAIDKIEDKGVPGYRFNDQAEELCSV